jgi:sugar phosphate isomerase/epimerase
MKYLPIAVNTYSYIYKLSALDAMRHLLEMGFQRFELLFNFDHIWVSELEPNIRRVLPSWVSEVGGEVISFNLPIMDHNLTSPNPDMRAFTIERFTELIELAGVWSVPYVVLVPGKISPLLPAPSASLTSWFFDGVNQLAERADQCGTKILVENVPVTFAPLASDLSRALDELADERVGVVYDVANGFFAGEDPASGIQTLRDRIDLVHLSDTGRKHWRHDPIGAGEIDFESVAKAIQSINFSGQSVMEVISSDPDRELPESRRLLAQWGWQGSEPE